METHFLPPDLWRPKITVGAYLRTFSLLLTFVQNVGSREFYLCFSAYSNTKVYHAREKIDFYPKIGRLNFLASGGASQQFVVKMSQILDKIPKCLVSAVFAMSRGYYPEKYLEIINNELSLAYRIFPKDDFGLLLRTLLSNITNLRQLSAHYRTEEFLLLLRAKFLINLSIVYEFNRFYMGFGVDQLVAFSAGQGTLDSASEKIAELINASKLSDDGNPLTRFEFLINSVGFILPTYDIE